MVQEEALQDSGDASPESSASENSASESSSSGGAGGSTSGETTMQEPTMMAESTMDESTMEGSGMETTMEETTGGAVAGGAGGAGDAASVQILAINDFEGNLRPSDNDEGRQVGGAAFLAAALDQREEENPEGTIRVHAGDLVGASPLISSYFHDEPSILASNLMDFDVATLGNHEFDEGGEEMFRLLDGGQREDGQEIKNDRNTSDPDFPGADYPYVSANVLDAETGENILPPYEIIESNGVEVGFIGITTTAAPEVVTPDAVEPFEFRDISDSVNEAAAELQGEGVEAIVVIAHEGNENEDVDPVEGNIVEEIEQMDDSVDTVIAGNTEFPIDEEIGGIYTVQAAGKSADYAVADLEIDRETGDVTSASGEVVAFDNRELNPDPEMVSLVRESRQAIAPIAGEEVGEAAGVITTEANDAGESPLGNLIADAQREYAGADLAFMNPGGIRDDIPEGETTYGTLFAVQPFNNQLVRVEMTGEEIKTLLEQQFTLEVPTTLQVSGLTYTYDEAAAERERATEVTLEGGEALDPSRTYTVALNSFLLTGGDGFTTFTESENPETVGGDLDALVEYVRDAEQPYQAPEDAERISAAGSE